jgi:putative GTP pyrophosphokinase
MRKEVETADPGSTRGAQSIVASISKTQVDKLGDRLRKGKLEEEDSRRLDSYRRLFTEAYEEVVAIIRDATKLDPTGRTAKSTTSITEKLRREKIRLTQMQDIAGCRLVVPDVAAQNQVVDRIMTVLPQADLVDRRKKPSFGYRAVHIIATARDRPVEIQVRTELQHLWAQLSEKLSDVFDPGIKYGGGGSETQYTLYHYSNLIAAYEELELRPSAKDLAVALPALRQNIRQLLERAITSWGSNSKPEGGN